MCSSIGWLVPLVCPSGRAPSSWRYSPVAAWRLIRRGCRTHFVHFHSYPVLSNASQEKARELARTLTRYQMSSRLHLVAFAPIQQQVVVSTPPALRIVIYRRMMLRIADELARRAG